MISRSSSSFAHVMPANEERNGNSVKPRPATTDLFDARSCGPRPGHCELSAWTATGPVSKAVQASD